ncbi:casein lytic proteinase B4 [Actinidia rufa]|uniref:Casein lytic proteinase B4 n=1 Tax=Actinidia rufa TaxID=165716 RepID=A0A7J0DVJ3_9ERIC|nr:casein lytic proteinase B4 [Actinidia rufa]
MNIVKKMNQPRKSSYLDIYNFADFFGVQRNSVRAFASSVLPTPVGLMNMKLAIGRFGSDNPTLEPIDLVDEAAEKLKMKITSKLIELDEIDRAMVKIDRVNLEIEVVECEYDLNRAAELKYGTLMSLQHPLEEVEKNHEREKLVMLELVLHSRIVGQDMTFKSVVDAIRRSRVGLSDPNHPIASFMFMRPTGVGKTELAKGLTEFMFNTEKALVRIDMSEYMEKHAVARLVGAPPGYVGYEEGGQLTEAIRRRPYSVVLFDEMENAHHDVFNILLQLLDGRITDSQGRTISFTNCVLIMTSNIGSQYILENLSSTHDDNKEAVYDMMKKQVIELSRQIFRPKFINRIDEYIVFKLLDSKEICKIVEIQGERHAQTNIDVQYIKESVELLAALGDFKEEDTIVVDVVASPLAKDLSAQKRLLIKKLENSPSMDAMVAKSYTRELYM